MCPGCGREILSRVITYYPRQKGYWTEYGSCPCCGEQPFPEKIPPEEVYKMGLPAPVKTGIDKIDLGFLELEIKLQKLKDQLDRIGFYVK